MSTSTEKTTDLLAAVLADLAPVVAAVTEQQKNGPTRAPSTTWPS